MEDHSGLKAYDQKIIEKKWYDFWLHTDCFSPTRDDTKPAYSMVIYPPNISGSLQIENALNATLQDVLIRWKRMHGLRVFLIPGTSHGGISTQSAIDKEILKESLIRNAIGRETFVDKAWQWKQTTAPGIVEKLKRLGLSCDWSKERFTLDEGTMKAASYAFHTLFSEGLIYRIERVVHWCPSCLTALTDIEVEQEEAQGKLIYIRYPVLDESQYIVATTTRPETILGNAAIAVHPEDKRYSELIGKLVRVPLTNRTVPIIVDKDVDPRHGSGAINVTPSHNSSDEAIARRQFPTLPFITVIGIDGKMSQQGGKNLAGIDRYECRKMIMSALKEKHLIEKEQDTKVILGRCYRCKTITEPLPMPQWYIKVGSLTSDASETVSSGKIQFYPEGAKNNYISWLSTAKDWCISRQVWWGHRIPAWYCPECLMDNGHKQGDDIHVVLTRKIGRLKEGSYTELREEGISHNDIVKEALIIKVSMSVKPFTSETEPQCCPVCSNAHLLRDPDVIDPWFSLSIWPFAALGWPERTHNLQSYYPSTVLITSQDMMFFWVARIIIMGLKFTGTLPFKDVYIHPIVRDERGMKMTKSKGNVIDPVLLIEKYGSDPLRFTLTSYAAQGRDIRFSEDHIDGYRHFINKLWNASKYISISLKKHDFAMDEPVEIHIEAIHNAYLTNKQEITIPDRWILSKLSAAVTEIDKAFNEYRFNDAAQIAYHFIWHEFCDWYLEFTKTTLEGPTVINTLRCLITVHDSVLKMLHPIIPFVTEELWHNYPHTMKSISLCSYPRPMPYDSDADRAMNYVINTIAAIRNIRGELNIPPGKQLAALIKTTSKLAYNSLAENHKYIKDAAKLLSLEIGENVERPRVSATAIKTGMEVFVPLSGLFDVKAEIDRLGKELKKVDDVLRAISRKILNDDFMSQAPKDVVERERVKYEEQIEKKEKLLANIKKIKELEEKQS